MASLLCFAAAFVLVVQTDAFTRKLYAPKDGPLFHTGAPLENPKRNGQGG